MLIVEDSDVDAELLCHGLDEATTDLETEVQNSVAKALESVGPGSGRAPPDLILLDLGLGSESGFELLDRVRAGTGLSRTPVIVLTGSEDESDISHAKEAGAATYYLKPRDLDGFIELGREIKEFWIDRLRQPSG